MGRVWRWIPCVGLALLVCTSQLGCGGKKKSDASGERTGGSNAPAKKWTCSKDSDCTVSCTEAGSCCGQGCECTNVYHRDELSAVLQQNRANCAGRDVECRQYRCNKPSHKTVAKCEEGRCEGVTVPLAALPEIDRACASDSDCVGVYHKYVSDGSCCASCNTDAVATRWVASAEAACSAMGSDGCPTKKCAALSPVACKAGTCR